MFENQNLFTTTTHLNLIGKNLLWLKGGLLGFLLFVIIVCGTFLIPFPDFIDGRVQLYSANPPVHLVSKSDGEIAYLNVSQDEVVPENKILMILSSNSNYKDVFALKEILLGDSLLNYNILQFQSRYQTNLILNENLQKEYFNYLESYLNIIKQRNFQSLNSNYENKLSQLKTSKNLLSTLEENLAVKENQISQYEIQLNRYTILYDKGVISKNEYEKEIERLQNIEVEYLNTVREYSSHELRHLDFEQKTVIAKNNSLFNIQADTKLLESKRQHLLSVINAWENKYVIRSPFKGKVSVVNSLFINKIIRNEEHLATVFQLGQKTILADCFVPLRNSAKIRTGNPVNIELANYPKSEWGILKGKVLTISETPNFEQNSRLHLQIKVSDLQTSFGKEITLRQEMQGTAKIIIEDLNLFERLLYQFRTIWIN